MKIKQFIDLEKSMNKNTFNDKYNFLDKFLNFVSILGNGASIFFAFFFLNLLLIRATSDFTGRMVVTTCSSIVLLTLYELLKRFVFKNLSIAYLINRKLNTEIIYNLVFGLILLSGSFYTSLSGAKIFADQRESVKMELKVETKAIVDSLSTLYEEKIYATVEERDMLMADKKIYNEKIKVTDYTSRLNQYQMLIEKANKEIGNVDKERERLRDERDEKIKAVTSENKSISNEKVEEISQNQTAFILISSFIELLIIVGVWFHSLFNLTIYNEYKENTKSNKNYNLYMSYSRLLSLLYNNGKVKQEGGLPSITSFIKFTKSKEDYSIKAIKEFINMCKNLGIIAVGKQRKNIAAMKYSDAKNTIMEYFDEEN